MGRERREHRPPVVDYSSDDEEMAIEEVAADPPPRPSRAAAPRRAASHGGGDDGGQPSRGRRGKKTAARKSKGKGRADAEEDDIDSPSDTTEVITGLVPTRVVFAGRYVSPVSISVGGSKGRSDKIRRQRFEEPFMNVNDNGLFNDYRFFNLFQAAFYQEVIMKKKTPVTKQRFIDWEGALKSKIPPLLKALEIMEDKGLRQIMELEKSWNTEVICQFYATVWYTRANEEDGTPPYMNFAIQGEPYRVSYPRFAKILGFSDVDLEREYVHDSDPIQRQRELAWIHDDTSQMLWKTGNIKPVYRYVNQLVRMTLMPKAGDETNISSTAQTLLGFLAAENKKSFSVFDVVWREIMETSWIAKKSCTHAPYLMKMIEVVTKKRFEADAIHLSYKPGPLKRIAGPPVADPSHESESSPSHVSASSARGGDSRSTSRSTRRPQRGFGASIMRGLRSVFKICRDNAEELAAQSRRLNELQENYQRHAAGQPMVPLEPLPPRAPIATTLEAHHLETFGEPLVSEEEDVEDDAPSAPGPYAYHGWNPWQSGEGGLF